jgi:hypothetical protein
VKQSKGDKWGFAALLKSGDTLEMKMLSEFSGEEEALRVATLVYKDRCEKEHGPYVGIRVFKQSEEKRRAAPPTNKQQQQQPQKSLSPPWSKAPYL